MLSAGDKLGPYEIVGPLGAGGMGEVYRARDTRLDRTVAVKILPSHLSENAEAKQRFEREARAISALNHPNICTLFDVGHQDGTDYLVMEFLEGETLADRLRKGPLPLEQVLKYGVDICEGLEKAHRTGVLHRDLKPGNIMVTKTGAKLMDFGLAKAVSPSSSASGLTATLASPAGSHPLTAQGTLVGTFQYLSPEQIEGKDADARSDIFALGAVLYEMATGKRAFEGKSTASVIAAILASEPQPVSTVQPMSPPALDRVIKSCMTKDPDERLQTAHDVKLQLKWIAEGGSQTGALPTIVARRKNWSHAGWFTAALLLLIMIAGGAIWWLSARQTKPAMYFNALVPFAANDIAISPDGHTVALVAYSEQVNKYVIWRYEVGGRETVSIPGTENASHPFWSPDGRSVGFFADGKLKKIEVSSGRSPQVLCDAPNGRGGTWNRDGVILFSPHVRGGVHRVSSAGGLATEITKPDGLVSSHRWPSFLPDGRHFLFLAANFGGEVDKNAILVGSLDSQEKHLVVRASSNAAYAYPGYLLYVRDNALVAQRFDADTYSLIGEPRTVSDEVQYFPQTDLALFAVAAGRTLAVQTGKGADKSQLLWFDRSGKQVGAVGHPGVFANPALSPDARRVAFEQTDREGRHVDVWIRDLANDAVGRLTFGPGLNELPVWSPDSKQIVFGGLRKDTWGLIEKNADGSGSERQIADSSLDIQGPWGWSRDGKYLLMFKSGELWYTSVSNPQPKPLFQGNRVIRNAQISPNGKWLAYSSNDSGNWEIDVSPFPGVDSKWQVSSGGGHEPRWRRDGKEIFYLSAEEKMMAVLVNTDNNFQAEPPVTMFQAHLRQPISVLDRVSYDVSADGNKFLINTKVDEPNAAPLSVILNWASEIEK